MEEIINRALAFLKLNFEKLGEKIDNIPETEVDFSSTNKEIKEVRESITQQTENIGNVLISLGKNDNENLVKLVETIDGVKKSVDLIELPEFNAQEFAESIEKIDLSAIDESNKHLLNLVEGLKTQSELLKKLQDKKQDDTEVKKTNKLLGDVIEAVHSIELETNDVDVSELPKITKTLLALQKDLKSKTNADIVKQLSEIVEKLDSLKVVFPKTFKLDEMQLRALKPKGGTSNIFGGPVLTKDLEGVGDVTVGTSQVEIAITGRPTSIRIQADVSNTNTIYIGKTGVLSDGTNDFVRLAAGDEVIIDYNDITNALYAISDAAAQTINVGALL